MSTAAGEGQPEHSRKADVSSVTNGAFRPLLLSGTGGVGDIWICVSNTEEAARISGLKNFGTKGGPGSLYAVKIPSKGTQDALPQEVTALKHVAFIPTPNNKHMQQYVAHDMLHDETTWLASQAVVGCTLWQLHKVAEAESTPLPKSLVLTIALQLCDALDALQDMNPPFFHEDLCHSNIMLDLEMRDGKGAPTVVVIDFGRGRPRKDPPNIDLDLSTFYRVVDDLASWGSAGSGQDSKWDSFVEFVASNNSTFEKKPCKEFRKQFEGYGKDIWDGISEDDRAKIDLLLNEASQIMVRARSLA
ncbi:hypothetical protein P171DRAFT_438524 [Karstenula rhodostoma CBS 690.94]|uniref:EKC/KEOPS complex subunit BUD32 n=1 Tax=Karstenula rhodostoma CBS 690.94 TaxID=1392251 RepID=A0A9P4PX45_9PLEO|nr:hypothetical protein P171DRAFT_438524 [Karstenula rhodostoma CBS 690.94]